MNRLFCGILLALSALLIGSGLLFRSGRGDFRLESSPSPTELPLNERFDETMVTTELDLPSSAWYSLQVGAYENEESALQLAQQFRKRGAAGYLWHDGRFRVLAAVYLSRDDAQTVRDQLREQHSIDSYIYPIEFPSVKLRVSGMQGQLEILKAAFGHVNALAKELHEVSNALDRQELSADEALEKLNALQVQMDLVALRLKQRFVPPVPEVVQSMIVCFEEYSEFVSKLSETEAMVALGMKLKYQTISVLWDLKKIYMALSYT